MLQLYNKMRHVTGSQTTLVLRRQKTTRNIAFKLKDAFEIPNYVLSATKPAALKVFLLASSSIITSSCRVNLNEDSCRCVLKWQYPLGTVVK